MHRKFFGGLFCIKRNRTLLSVVSNPDAPAIPITRCIPIIETTRDCSSIGGGAVFRPPIVLTDSFLYNATAFLEELLISHHLFSTCSLVLLNPVILTEFTCIMEYNFKMYPNRKSLSTLLRFVSSLFIFWCQFVIVRCCYSHCVRSETKVV